MSNGFTEALMGAGEEGPWDDADVKRFIDRLGQFGVKLSLFDGSENEEPKDAVDIRPESAIAGLPPDFLFGFWAHRRDLACYLRGLRGEARAAAVADAQGEWRRAMRPHFERLKEAGVDARVQGVPIDQLPPDEVRGRRN